MPIMNTVIKGGGTPVSGTITLPANGVYNVSSYEYADVQVPSTAPNFYIELNADSTTHTFNTKKVPTFASGITNTIIGDQYFRYEYYNMAFPTVTNVDWSGITHINTYGLSYGFYGCSNLGSVDLRGLTDVGANGLQNAFYGSSITSLDLRSFNPSSSVSSACASMCRNCSALTTVDISSMQNLAWSYMFAGCTSLTTINASSVNNISASYMFQGCSSLTSINFASVVSASYASYAFQNCTNLTTVGGKLTTTTGGLSYMFAGCTSLSTVDLSGITSITSSCQYMFQGCTSLINVDLSNLTSITGQTVCKNMFDGCTGLKTLDLSGLTTVTGYQSATSPTQSPMYQMCSGCTSLESVDLSNLTTLGSSYGFVETFADCSSLKTVNLGSLVQVTQNVSFQKCFYRCPVENYDMHNLTTVTANSVFYDCFIRNNITNLDFLSSLETVTGVSVFRFAFESCSNLTNATFWSLETLSSGGSFQSALGYCSALTTVSFPAMSASSASNWSSSSPFNNLLTSCNNVTVHFPSNLQSITSSYPDFVSGFNGRNTIILYDLVATNTLVGADSQNYYRNPKYDTATALGWYNKASTRSTPYYTSGLTDPVVGDTIYSDDACTTAVTTISSIA